MTPEPYILLVDDEPHNLMLLEDLLEMEGYVTRSASSGAEALSMAGESPPQLVLLDVMMPDMNGFEVCEQMRTQPALQTTPIIFLTALDDDESRIRGVTALGDDYLTKPIRTELVLTKIASVLRLTQLRQQTYQQQLQQQETLFRERQQQFQQQMQLAAQTQAELSDTLKRFVPPQFLAHLAPTGTAKSLDLGATTPTEVTVLFCDIRNFTAIAETQTPEQTLTWLNAFFAELNSAIGQHHGFIDKYLGDAVMAVFDRPAHHAADALHGALLMRWALERFNQTCDQLELSHPIAVGIGIHSGPVVMGTVGDNQRMDTTVIGDVVNTAARLEDLTKTYQCPILFSQGVIHQLPPDHGFNYRWVADVTPRGKQAQMAIYTLLGNQKGDLPGESCDHRQTVEQH
jgi:adenylate cyclase